MYTQAFGGAPGCASRGPYQRGLLIASPLFTAVLSGLARAIIAYDSFPVVARVFSITSFQELTNGTVTDFLDIASKNGIRHILRNVC